MQALIAGDNNKDAYCKAYPKALNWTERSVAVEASKLLKKPNVQARYLQLKEQYIAIVTEKSSNNLSLS